ncbi:MAG: sodium:calcium antiporter [bacterium]|nr:sodium:calcium antiporter [bacterium]
MLVFLHILLFIGSCALLAFSGKWLVDTLARVALFLKLKEFVVAFFIVAFGTTIPNLIIGIISALNNIPELSFGDVMGSNIFDLTIVMGLAALISRGGLSSQSRTVQGSSAFTMAIAILPLLLIFDGKLSRMDGILLLMSFFIYAGWLFSKRDRFTKVYDGVKESITLGEFLKDFLIILAGLGLLILGGEGIVKSAIFFYQEWNLPLGLIGIFVVAIGTCLPETFFSLHAARKGQDWMILGNQMGNVVITSTFILGIVSLIQPIQIADFSLFAIARVFLIISAIAFFFFLKTNQKITRREGLFLIGIYVAFLIVEILAR